ncbi:MAG TPA: PLP-dependent aspartate aminotransferase family protein, partial [Candidatus Polarisedimenticolaceae bacterium]|nr:PLP-dependent aspartate aminotransferase family protein [Candidatus Polarisedimenticolaceae bacterium]
LAELEGGADALAFSSGMAAIASVAQLLEAGDHVLATENAYGGTRRLFDGLMTRFGLEFDWVDTSSTERIAAAFRPTTRMVFIETPTNPTLTLTDIAAVVEIIRQRRARLVVDNTFMTPCLQRPLALGADVVVHSTTKYLNGHSDSIGGAAIARDPADAERLGWIQRSVGAVLSPLDSFLVLRGIKTLSLRMARHQSSAVEIARWLERQPTVARVHYPGLDSHPQRALAARQMGGAGGVVSVDLGSRARAERFVAGLELWQLAESLGGVESLVSHPATMTHAWLDRAERERIGIGDGLLRLSVGVEDPADLLEDLERALTGV